MMVTFKNVGNKENRCSLIAVDPIREMAVETKRSLRILQHLKKEA